MPTRPPTPCRYPGCPALTRSGYCVAHAQTDRQRYEAKRASDARLLAAKMFRSSKAWQDFQAMFRRRHPLCEPCADRGIVTPTQQVHHKIGLVDRPDLGLVEYNCMAVCTRCHAEIEARVRHGQRT